MLTFWKDWHLINWLIWLGGSLVVGLVITMTWASIDWLALYFFGTKPTMDYYSMFWGAFAGCLVVWASQ